MIKKLFFITTQFLLMLISAFPAFALQTNADIPVVVEGGGTVNIVAEVNSPSPSQSSFFVQSGQTGHIIINFSSVGVYHYSIFAQNAENKPANEAYQATITVESISEGVLKAVVVLNQNGSNSKPDSAAFSFTSQTNTTNPTKPTQPTQPTKPTSPNSSTTTTIPRDQPRTGDDSNLNLYLLLSIGAALGLFLLAAIYAANTRRMSSKHR